MRTAGWLAKVGLSAQRLRTKQPAKLGNLMIFGTSIWKAIRDFIARSLCGSRYTGGSESQLMATQTRLGRFGFRPSKSCTRKQLIVCMIQALYASDSAQALSFAGQMGGVLNDCFAGSWHY